MKLGALEAGGTKMVCAIGDEHGSIHSRHTIKTGSPDETMPEIVDFYAGQGVDAIGVASFGPLDLNPGSPTYGYITSSPKSEWVNFHILPYIVERLGVPAMIDTDVNAAALAEIKLGAARGANSCLYVTVGTGIGGGVVAEGQLVHGLMHPEFGHMLLRPSPDDPMPEGICRFHASCLEGLACGPALEARWGRPAFELGADHPAWQIESEYLAQMCANAIFCLSPERIILGGGVMKQSQLYDMIRSRTGCLLGGYMNLDALTNHMDDYIVPPGLSGNSGATGALLLAAEAIAASPAPSN